jgi:hypothetical protein
MPYPRRRARQEQTPRLQRRPLTQIANLLPHIENHIPRMPILHRLPVINRPNPQRLRILDHLPRHQHRAYGTAAVEALAEAPLRRQQLHGARADVVGGRVAEDVVQRFGLGDIAAAFAYDKAEFGFVVGGAVLGAAGDVDCDWVGAR